VTIAGQRFTLQRRQVERRMRGILPDPVVEHFVVVNGRQYPPKQVISQATGLDRADFATHQARRILMRLGFAAGRREVPFSQAGGATRRSSAHHDLVETLRSFVGQWVAIKGEEVLVAASSPQRGGGMALPAWAARRHDVQGARRRGRSQRPRAVVKFPFRHIPAGSTEVRARPIVDVVVEGLELAPQACLLDSGATVVRMGLHVAELVGADVSGGPIEPIAVGGGVVQGRMAEVSLEVRDGSTSHRWEAPVWFCDPWRPAFGLLGLTGFFDHFLVTVCACEEWVDLRPMSA
jgi:hypothetical protein